MLGQVTHDQVLPSSRFPRSYQHLSAPSPIADVETRRVVLYPVDRSRWIDSNHQGCVQSGQNTSLPSFYTVSDGTI